jgi:hypothetical protein
MNWETELEGKSWLASASLFVALILLGVLAPLLAVVPSYTLLALLLFLMLCLHSMTFHYATMRPGVVIIVVGTPAVFSLTRERLLAELCTVRKSDGDKRKYGCLRTRFRVYYWRNYVSVVIIVLETAQLLAVALDQRYRCLNSSFVNNKWGCCVFSSWQPSRGP